MEISDLKSWKNYMRTILCLIFCVTPNAGANDLFIVLSSIDAPSADVDQFIEPNPKLLPFRFYLADQIPNDPTQNFLIKIQKVLISHQKSVKMDVLESYFERHWNAQYVQHFQSLAQQILNDPLLSDHERTLANSILQNNSSQRHSNSLSIPFPASVLVNHQRFDLQPNQILQLPDGWVRITVLTDRFKPWIYVGLAHQFRSEQMKDLQPLVESAQCEAPHQDYSEYFRGKEPLKNLLIFIQSDCILQRTPLGWQPYESSLAQPSFSSLSNPEAEKANAPLKKSSRSIQWIGFVTSLALLLL